MKQEKRGDATSGDVRRVAMNLLARREHARAELSRKLTDRGFQAELVDAVLVDLENDGLQSEARFAESLVASAVRRGKGPAHVRMQLRRSGVDAGAAAQALAACGADWFALAKKARLRKFGDTPPADRREQARQARFLQQRGFDNETIYRVLGDI